MTLAPGLLLALSGCTDDTIPVDTGSPSTRDSADTATADSGDTSDTGDSGGPCTLGVAATEPADGAFGVFWRDSLRVWFDGSWRDRLSAPVFSLVADAEGTELPLAATWDEGEDTVTLTPSEPLAPDSLFTLGIDACGALTEANFATSAYGTPVTDGASSLLGRTWVLRTEQIEWTQPESGGELLAAFFTEVMLIGVQDVRDDVIDLLVGVGGFTDLEGFEQLVGQGTWDVPEVDFSHGAWFEAHGESIAFSANGVTVPVFDFTLAGTFASDGTEIAGASLGGLVDTRELDEVFNLDQPDFVCTTVASEYGFTCEACPDGEELCVRVAGEDITLLEQPGLTLERNPQE